jgi:hypothetical protein
VLKTQNMHNKALKAMADLGIKYKQFGIAPTGYSIF